MRDKISDGVQVKSSVKPDRAAGLERPDHEHLSGRKIMTRKETTTFLSDLLIRKKFGGIGKYWAREVSIDPLTIGKAKRVDFIQFIPENQCSIGAIEKGIFVCYEIKSCIEDVYSGNGLNFLGEKNYIVTTMECYKKLIADMNEGKFWRHLNEGFPESSSNIGIMVPVPFMKTIEDEFESPHPLTSEISWELKTIIRCIPGKRQKSMTELLFCMLRSGR